jgi:hypothetical protein
MSTAFKSGILLVGLVSLAVSAPHSSVDVRASGHAKAFDLGEVVWRFGSKFYDKVSILSNSVSAEKFSDKVSSCV